MKLVFLTYQLVILNHPDAIHAGNAPVFHCHTAHMACKFAELLEKIERRTNEKLKDNSHMVKYGHAAIIKLKHELSKQGQYLFDRSTL